MSRKTKRTRRHVPRPRPPAPAELLTRILVSEDVVSIMRCGVCNRGFLIPLADIPAVADDHPDGDLCGHGRGDG